MIYINDHWEEVRDLQDVSKIVREYFNEDLADELDKLIPEHTDEEYEDLQWDYDRKCDNVTDLENELSDLEKENERLEDKIEELEEKLNEQN